MLSDEDNIEQDNLVADNSCGQTIEITYVPEFRRNPRIEECILAETITESGEMVVGIIIDISLSGLRLEGSRLMVDALLPSSIFQNNYLSTPLQISFALPETSAHGISAKIWCDAIYSRSHEENVYQIGMQFIAFEKGATELAEHLISKDPT